MTIKVSSIGLKGLEGYRVHVEVQISFGLQSMVIVGLPDRSVKESKQRVLSAIRSLGSDQILQKITVNLSPSDQRKNGPLFDLAIAIGILKEVGFIKQEIPDNTAFIGALSLDGGVEKIAGLLPAIIAAAELGFEKVYMPFDPLLPVDILENIECIAVQNLQDVMNHLAGRRIFLPKNNPSQSPDDLFSQDDFPKDFSHIIGHDFAKKALEVSAAGGHHVLLSGPPGCGKSLLAETFPSILPPLTRHQQLEVLSLYQLANESLQVSQQAPFRQPHHSASAISIIGGGTYPKPGEISLAHHGVLFLDEMAEFTKKTLDMLRQPLESGKVTISRVHSTVTYPATFLLIGAMNPCPCGYLGSATRYCTCTIKQIQAYRNRVSGPIYDRMDILLALNSVNLDEQAGRRETSLDIRSRVKKAREKQYLRYQQPLTNAKVPYELFMKTSLVTEAQMNWLADQAIKNGWSSRVQLKILRLARTIADLNNETKIPNQALHQAAQFRKHGDGSSAS